MILRAKRQFRQRIGQILMDGGFLNKNKLDRACEYQKHTHELLGQVLVKMGVINACDIKTPLLIQDQLSTIDDAVKIAAGEHQLLGALLIDSGKITAKQLDTAIAEQKRSGEKLGEVFTRLGMLNERQLAALLDFQHNQDDTNNINSLRLGELLVATGYISREQLNEAIVKHKESHKKIGEVLVESGYLTPSNLRKGFRLQRMLIKSVLGSILTLGISAPAMASSVSLQWDPAAGTGLAGYKLYYSDTASPFDNKTPIDVSIQTVASINGLDPAKTYNFAVTAYDTSGAETASSNIVTLAEQMPPNVTITSPLNATNVNGVVSVNVATTDNVGVTKVEFYVNGILQATETAEPYVFSWNTSSVASGTYSLVVKAYDAAGNVGQASSSVTVVNDIIAPTVTMTSPVNNSTLRGAVTISSNASDNVGVSLIEFYCNNTLLYASNSAPYSFNWDTTTFSDGAYTLVAKARDNAGNSSQSLPISVTINNNVSDIVAPILTGFTLPATATSLTVPISGLSASDAVGVTGYLVSENATKPVATDTRWSNTAPASITFSAGGTRTAYAWAKDAAGNISASRSASVVITLPATSAGTVVFADNSGGTQFKDLAGVTYLADSKYTGGSIGKTTTAISGTVDDSIYQTERYGNFSYAVPVANGNYNVTLKFAETYFSAAGQRVFSVKINGLTVISNLDIFAKVGKNTAYDVVIPVSVTNGNLSIQFVSQVNNAKVCGILVQAPDTIAPTLLSFTLPATATTLTVPVSGLSGTDAVGVTGYLVSESATKPLATDARWSSSAPSSITFSSAGTKTAYAWVKNAAGYVSDSRSATVVITLPDLTLPTITAFTLPATSNSLTVPVSGLSAADAVGVTGYLVSESSTEPVATDARWSSSVPTSITFSAAGTKTAYAWAKDAAGNISASRSASVVITLPTTTAGTVVFADNSGGTQFKDLAGVTYLADSKYTGGSIGKTTSAISGTVDDTIYQTERYGNFSYAVPVANGNYNVTLKFAETYFSAAGQRVFSVKINGLTVLSNLDIYAKVGKNAAYDVVIPVSVTNGSLKIEFVNQVNNAKVNGILVKTR